jgi:hypothetical protein
MKKIFISTLAIGFLLLTAACAPKNSSTGFNTGPDGSAKKPQTDPNALCDTNPIPVIQAGTAPMSASEFVVGITSGSHRDKLSAIDVYVNADSGAKAFFEWKRLDGSLDTNLEARATCLRMEDGQTLQVQFKFPELLAKKGGDLGGVIAMGSYMLNFSIEKFAGREVDSLIALDGIFTDPAYEIGFNSHMYLQGVTGHSFETTNRITARQYRLSNEKVEVRYTIERYKDGAHVQQETYRLVYHRF